MKFKEGKIIERFKTKDGREVIIRYLRKSDARGCMKYTNSLIEENAMIGRVKPLTLKEEKKKINEFLRLMRENEAIYIIADFNSMIIGMSDVKRSKYGVQQHVGEVGIGLVKEFRGLGLAKRMVKIMENLATKRLKSEILTLTVFAKNKAALRLYKKSGFKIAGKIPRGIKRHGVYDTDIIMYKVLK